MYITADTTFIPNVSARNAFEAAVNKGHMLVAVLCPPVQGRKAQVIVATGYGPVPCTVQIGEAPSTLNERDICTVNFRVEKREDQYHIHGQSEYFFGND